MLEKELNTYSNRIYRKLYLYALMVMIISIMLTFFVTSLFLRANEQKGFERHVKGNAILVKNVLKELNLLQFKNSFPLNKKIIISDKPGLAIEFIPNIDKLKEKSLITKDSIDELVKTKEAQVIRVEQEKPAVILFLDENNTNSGILYLEDFHLIKGFRPHPPRPEKIKPEVLGSLFILTFLSILLIPYSRYIFKPFKELTISIDRVASGDFKTLIDVSKKSDFKGIADSFNNMTMKIHEMIQQRDRLIADVSHELRTPLTRIRLSLELLDKEGKGKKKYIDKSINEIEQLDLLIDDLLDASKLELNKNDFIFEKNSLQKIVEENIEKNNILFLENNLEIAKNFFDNDLYINSNKQLLERALGNIFSNIIKYAPQSSKVDITIFRKDKNVILSIRDRGEGVSFDEYDKIFQPFYRSDTSRSRKTGGTGLGLSIVKQIIKLHDGEIIAKKPDDNQSGLVLELKFPIVS